MKIVVRSIILLVLAIGIGYCLHIFGQGNLSPKETSLLGIVLTGLSIFASWAVTDMYSESQSKQAIEDVQELHRSNLRTYALKAAEKVTNLSNELNKLSAYLQQELDCDDYRSVEEELHSKEERVESAIHIINTLKSANDTSLSDWQGVIGEELEEQREEIIEREAEFRETLERMEQLVAIQTSELQSRQESTQSVRDEVDALRRDLRFMVSAASGIPVPLPRILKDSKSVRGRCPSCGASIQYRQSPRKTGIKALRCSQCDTALVSRFDESSGYRLSLRLPQNEAVVCPKCTSVTTVALDPVPGFRLRITCEKCGARIRISRSGQSLVVREEPQPPPPALPDGGPLTEDIVERVAQELPPQPWPHGTHRSVAEKLGLSVSLVRRATGKLVDDGRFLQQIDGKLYAPVEPSQPGS